MSTLVVLSPEAQEKSFEILDYWLANSPKKAVVFESELGVALTQLASFPMSGEEYNEKTGIRRKLLRASEYYLYYDFDEKKGIVEVVTIWSTKRGSTPQL
jgi:plasmid stabilization system protein ParE